MATKDHQQGTGQENDKKGNEGQDPYKKDPGAGRSDDERVDEAAEQEARQREGIRLQATDRLDDSTTAPLIDTGRVGQMGRGSYGIDGTTGQGTYVERTQGGSTDTSTDPITSTPDLAGNDPRIAPEDPTQSPPAV